MTIGASSNMSAQHSTSSTSELPFATACPSSPPPLPLSDTEFGFYDLPDLTVSPSGFSANTLSTDFPPLSTLWAGDNEHLIMLGHESLTLNTSPSTKNLSDFPSDPTTISWPSLDEVLFKLDSDSEDEFVAGLVNKEIKKTVAQAKEG
jgi:hypothetical protein